MESVCWIWGTGGLRGGRGMMVTSQPLIGLNPSDDPS